MPALWLTDEHSFALLFIQDRLDNVKETRLRASADAIIVNMRT